MLSLHRSVRFFASVVACILLAFAVQSCTVEEKVIIKKRLVSEEADEVITRFDSAHGYGYPFTFQRAKSLRRAKMYVPAAYVYIHLFKDHPDSTVSEAVIMSEEAIAFDSTRLPSYYFQQAIGTEMLMDHAIKPPDGKINQVEMKKRYEWTSDLLNALGAKGVR